MNPLTIWLPIWRLRPAGPRQHGRPDRPYDDLVADLEAAVRPDRRSKRTRRSVEC